MGSYDILEPRTPKTPSTFPYGKPSMVAYTPLWSMMLNSFVGIPMYNAEMRIFGMGNSRGEKVLANFLSYDDGPVLNELYASARRRFKTLTQKEQEALLAGEETESGEGLLVGFVVIDVRILHRIYVNIALKNIVVVAGDLHIKNIYPWLIKLGYKQIFSPKNLTEQQHDNLYISMEQEARKVGNVCNNTMDLSKTIACRKKIGKIYSDYINTITLDISKLPRPKPQAAPAVQPAPVRRSKL
jgi:hypothetical protein